MSNICPVSQGTRVSGVWPESIVTGSDLGVDPSWVVSKSASLVFLEIGGHLISFNNIMVLIFIFLMINDAEHLFICLLAICRSSQKISIQILCSFFNQIIWGFYFFAI